MHRHDVLRNVGVGDLVTLIEDDEKQVGRDMIGAVMLMLWRRVLLLS